MSKHIQYAIKRQNDGQYVLIQKDQNGDLTIHSSHDTLEGANAQRDYLNSRPSQSEVLKFFNDLRDSINTQL